VSGGGQDWPVRGPERASAGRDAYVAGRDLAVTNYYLAGGDGDVGASYVNSILVVHAGPIVRSAYLEQVRRIAPVLLVDRGEELAELAGFSTEPDRGPYAWWQAAAWAGKTALMSWFVLHPPPGVRVVSFFITARFAGQSHRGAFIDAVLEQLADLLAESMPAYLTEATREAHLLDMFARAARACQRDGQRLVLVVDGLDEDLGWTTSTDAHSIAALLPSAPSASARVIVAGRPNPPVPADVPDTHPLRDPRVVRLLDPSAHAAVVQVDAQRELKRLVTGTQAEQDLLGLLTAATGGLSGPDLAELTGLPDWQIEEHLHTVSGRTFERLPSRWQPGTAPDVYLLGHEELRPLAATYLGASRLAACLQRLHAWADGYRERLWPAGTPEYLLRGYYRLLLVAGDLDRVVACATDQARHDRMLDLTGGDSSALSEIMAGQQAIVKQPEPDLLALVRLAIHRDNLAQRNTNVPLGLPAVWARLGRFDRAEALAGAIEDPSGRGEAFADLAKVAAASGDVGRARILADQAEATAASITVSDEQAWVYAAVAKAMAAAGDLSRARDLAGRARTLAGQSIRDESSTAMGRRLLREEAFYRPYPEPWQSWTAAALVEVTAIAGEPDRTGFLSQVHTQAVALFITVRGLVLTDLAQMIADARDMNTVRILADLADALIGSMTGPSSQALAALAKAAADAGDLARARVAADRAEAMVRTVSDQDWRAGTGSLAKADALTAAAEAMAAAGDLSRSRVLAGQAASLVGSSIIDTGRRADGLAALAKATALAGDLDRAEALVSSITDPYWLSQGLTALVAAAVTAGDPGQVRSLAERARVLASSITDPEQQGRTLKTLATAVAAAGDPDQAQAIAGCITDPWGQAYTLTALANAMAASGDFGRARIAAFRAQSLVSSVTNPYRQARQLTDVAKAIASAGDPDRARELAARAQAVASVAASPVTRADEWQQAQALADAAKAMAMAGDGDRAQAAAQAITDPSSQALALADIAQILAGAGDLDGAETVARSIADESCQGKALGAVVNAAIEAGNLDVAETMACSIRDDIQQAWALILAVKAELAAGRLDRAETLTGSIWPPQKVEALAEVAKAMAVAGRPDRARILFDQAEELACSSAMIDLYWQFLAFARLIKATAAAQDWHRTIKLIDWAEANARASTRQAERFSELAMIVAAAGYRIPAFAFAAQADALARSISRGHEQAQALARVAKAIAAAGDTRRAQAAADSITDPNSRAQALADVADVMMAAGELDRAQAVANSIANPGQRAESLAALAEALIAAGELDRARAVASSITTPHLQARTLAALAKVLAAAGDPDRAEDVINSITESGLLAKALADLAGTVQPTRARRLVARAFSAGDWTLSLDALAKIQPFVLAQVADELLSEADQPSSTPESAVRKQPGGADPGKSGCSRP
jgi:tetratricopeptide (TPR) repeat protein